VGRMEEIERRVQALATTDEHRQYIARIKFQDHARADVPWLLTRVRELETELRHRDERDHL
jgi:hypothetical protein